ncbi:hypothetical protein ACQ4PT_009736 [Festuca glaucescens]
MDMVNRMGTSFCEIEFPTYWESEEPRSSPSENETVEEDDMEFDHNGAEGMISADIECLSDVNLEQIMKEIDASYGLREELDVRSLEDNLIMGASIEAMSASPEAVPAPDADEIADGVATLSGSIESSRSSCFTAWKRSSGSSVAREPQKLLKKAVAGGAWADNAGGSTARGRESNVKGHVMSGRRRREKLNKLFLILKSSVPSIHKVDKASIIAETIAYLKELEQRIEELESSRAPTTRPTKTTGWRRHGVAGKEVSAGSKRKASEPCESNDGPINVITVTVMEKEVLLEVRCRWKQLLMTRVFDALKALSLDVLSVLSSTPDGLLALKIRAQYAGSAAVAPAGMISEALQRAALKGVEE